MSLFGIKLFGSKKTPPTPAEAIQRLRDVEEMLMKKSDFLEKKVEAELQTAKKNGTKNKRVALMALKRKKRYEKQLTQIDGTLSTIEFQREALENASTNSEVLKVMGTAAKALKGAHDNMDIDQVHNLMDDVAEQQEIANEISEAISNPTGLGEDFDEDDLLSELNELEEEELNRQLLDVNVDVPQDLPSVPTSEPEAAAASSSRPRPVAAKADDDDDMRELQMWAS